KNWYDDIKVVLATGEQFEQTLPLGQNGPGKILAGDVDGNGRVDIVKVSEIEGGVSTVYTYRSVNDEFGNARFSETPIVTPTSACAIGGRFAILTDLDSDGKNDLASWDNRVGQICVWKGLETGGFGDVVLSSTTSLGFFQPSGHFSDINGDQKKDFISVHKETGDIFIYISHGDGTFEEAPKF
ncbi:MAG: VCBS repeat-containing protein, partial [Proteobacteria bacterium]|nr:VCBS repeat-containing protein [Pseudomonadota bacterium]